MNDDYKYVSAGQAEGIDLWENRIDKSSCQHHVSPLDKFLPVSTPEEREIRFTRWQDAVGRCLGWAKPKKVIKNMTAQEQIYRSIPAAVFVCSTFGFVEKQQEYSWIGCMLFLFKTFNQP